LRLEAERTPTENAVGKRERRNNTGTVRQSIQEKRVVHSIGPVQLIFSTTEQTLSNATPDNVKILMSNNQRLRPAELVELYTLRWQIELLFKVLKGTLGMDQYRFQKFAAVEGWIETAVLSMLYLEWYRLDQLNRKDLVEAERKWWDRQRAHGICQVIRLRSQQADLEYIAARLQTDGGTKKLKRLVREAIPHEY
jgi:IS4 transposase